MTCRAFSCDLPSRAAEDDPDGMHPDCAAYEAERQERAACGPFCQGTDAEHAAPGTGYFPCFPCGHVAPTQRALDLHHNAGHAPQALVSA